MMFNKHGFSLIEVMIGIAMLSGVSLLVMRIQDNASFNEQKMTIDQEINSIAFQMNKVLSDVATCSASLQGHNFTNLKSVNEIRHRIEDDLGNSFPSDPYFKVGQMIGHSRLKISEMNLINKDKSNNLIPEALEVTFRYEKNGKEVFVFKKMAIQTKEAAGVITGCQTEDSFLEEEALDDACSILQATYDRSTGKCNFKNNLPKCFLTSETSCPAAFPNIENVKIAVQVPGRKSCSTRYTRKNIVCVEHHSGVAAGSSWVWHGNCEPVDRNDVVWCNAPNPPVDYGCFDEEPNNCTLTPETAEQDFKFCCRN